MTSKLGGGIEDHACCCNQVKVFVMLKSGDFLNFKLTFDKKVFGSQNRTRLQQLSHKNCVNMGRRGKTGWAVYLVNRAFVKISFSAVT